MNKYREQLIEILRELRHSGLLSPQVYGALQKVEDLLDDPDLLMVNKNCLPLTFEKKKLPEYLFNPKNPELEYSLSLRLSSKQIVPVFSGPSEECIKEKLTKDMCYYLENFDYPRDRGDGFQILYQEDYFKKDDE